ncbi:T9SS C-terminal target domain-containing protein [Flavobacterium circumlabens]|uniref:Secreted protein (Por secretion system target) n=1 Tax=Flavobacterium circumlabens TaxID=2133765 RepID=A0A4Y7UAZ9_9FLAO|nr:T9SS type A sorting domain-containing protein [Flavobacterium circumlabens]TCN56619.1 putative secreted protein (Por secretion system target) [Flavobacterium circumlabens]TEB43627.1 T9SS C-terminal target domain-containing protein [Flavobacterium circumlabens]
MKNIYSLRNVIAYFSFFCCFSMSLVAQTMPAAQSLPYTQDFSFAATVATYPAGFQGWTVSTSNPSGTSQYATAATMVADRPLAISSTAAISSGNFHNYDGKIGFLNTGSLDLAIGFAFSTVGQTAIQVKYDAMTIRNPYDIPPATGSTRINEMVLQYRVGTTAAFVSLLPTAYVNNDVKQITAVTTPQNLKTIKVTLPAECENQPVVQIRWISKQNSGGGSRPSFAIDNVDVRSDIAAPVNATGYPQVSTVLSDGFDFSNKLDEAGKTYYVLLPSGSAEPTAAQIKSGLDASGTAALQSGFLDITDPSQVYVKTFTGLVINTSYAVFSISEDLYDNIQSTVNKVEVTTSSVVIPSLSTSTTSLDLGFSEANFDSETLSYQIQGSNLTNDVVVTAGANFSISKDNINFQSSLTYSVSDFVSNATPTVYVKFAPNATGIFSGQITHESTGAATKTVTLKGTGINPYVQGFNDTNVFTNSGWTQFNIAGAINKWSTTTVARNVNSGTGAVLMNGFSDNGASKDWLVSPRLRLDNFNQFPLLSFYTRKFYAGPGLKLMVSVDYDGKSSPETATWTEINGNFPTATGTYVQSQYINLGAYKTSHTYLAWVYETTAGGSNNASEWSFDDFAVTNETGYVASNPVLDFGDVSPDTVSAGKAFDFKADGYGDITVTAPSDYQISLDNTSFQSSIVVSAADAVAGKILYVRFTPSVKALTIAGALTVTGTGLNKPIGALTGSSLPKAETFDVVTYNLEFFGTDVKDKSGTEFGPTDDALQIENVAKVMNKLNADVYVVQEVSDDPAIDALIQKININGKTFDKTTSTSWSYSFLLNADPYFPPQKLVVLYNTQTTTVKNTKVLFKDVYDAVRAGTTVLPGYPGTETPQINDDSFFSSGRLPYLVQIETNIGGIKKEINLIDLHARANSGSDMMKYNQRKYDAEYLKEALDTEYPNSNLMILGDFNDDVKISVVGPTIPSSYQKIVEDTDRYNTLTLGISQAGAYSFLSSGGFLDHIVISNELTDQYIPNSIAVYDPRTDISGYTTTTSDHGPVIARFELKADNLATTDFENKNGYSVQAYPNPASDVVNVTVKTADDKNLKLRVYDLSGRLVVNPIEIKGTQEKNNLVIPVSNLKTGVYIYTLTENNKVIYSNKIIKK